MGCFFPPSTGGAFLSVRFLFCLHGAENGNKKGQFPFKENGSRNSYLAVPQQSWCCRHFEACALPWGVVEGLSRRVGAGAAATSAGLPEAYNSSMGRSELTFCFTRNPKVGHIPQNARCATSAVMPLGPPPPLHPAPIGTKS